MQILYACRMPAGLAHLACVLSANSEKKKTIAELIKRKGKKTIAELIKRKGKEAAFTISFPFNMNE